jgi:hypothetical protein
VSLPSCTALGRDRGPQAGRPRASRQQRTGRGTFRPILYGLLSALRPSQHPLLERQINRSSEFFFKRKSLRELYSLSNHSIAVPTVLFSVTVQIYYQYFYLERVDPFCLRRMGKYCFKNGRVFPNFFVDIVLFFRIKWRTSFSSRKE